MKKNRFFKKIALLLVFTMTVSHLSVLTFADDYDDSKIMCPIDENGVPIDVNDNQYYEECYDQTDVPTEEDDDEGLKTPPKPHPLEPEVLPPAVKNYKYKVHKYDPKKFVKHPSKEETLKYYRKMKKKYKNLKPKPLKFDLDFDNYELKFTDVPKNHRNREAIIWAVANGVIKNQKKPIRPDELATAADVIDYYWHLRAKYHIMQDEGEFMDLYDQLVFPYPSGFRCIAERSGYDPFIWFLTFSSQEIGMVAGSATEIIYTPYDKEHALSKYVYVPNSIINGGDLIGIAYMLCQAGALPGYDTEDDDSRDSFDSRKRLLNKNLTELLTTLSYSNYFLNKKDIKKAHKKRPIAISLTMYCMGIGQLQRMGYIKRNPKLKDLRLDRPITRGEIFQFMYDAAQTSKRADDRDMRCYSGNMLPFS